LEDKNLESIPYSGLVAYRETLDEAFKNARSMLTQGANNKDELQSLYVKDVLIALQVIQNTLHKKYEVYRKVKQDTE
tara:strand:+ start:58 stop:288 length:231 start_codon:yes stop_codon:yes gene_type:complete